MGSLLRDLLDAPARLALLATCLPLSKLVVQHLCGDAASEERPFKLVRRVVDEGDSDEEGAAPSSANDGAAAQQAPLALFSDALVGLVVDKWARTRLHVQLDGCCSRTYPYFNSSTPIAPPPASMLPFITRLELRAVTVTHELLLAVQQCVHLRELGVWCCLFEDCTDDAPREAPTLRPDSAAAAAATTTVITTSTTTTTASGATVTTTTTNTTRALAQSSTPAASTGAPPPPHVWRPLPHLRKLRVYFIDASYPPALLTLAAHATEFVHDSSRYFASMLAALPNVERVTKEERAYGTDVQVLLRHAAVRHVAVGGLEFAPDLRQQPCRWETLELRVLNPSQLLRLPLGDTLRQVVVTEELDLQNPDDAKALPGLVRRLGGRLAVRPQLTSGVLALGRDTLEAHETSFFLNTYELARLAEAQGCQWSSCATDLVLGGGGPEVLKLFTRCEDMTATVAWLAPALARSRVTTLWVDTKWMAGVDEQPEEVLGALAGALTQVLPSNVTHLSVRVDVFKAALALVARPPPHPLRLTLRRITHFASEERKQQLLQACAGHQPALELVLA